MSRRSLTRLSAALAFFAASMAAVGAQSPIAGRVAILLAAYRGATSSSDLAIIRAGIRSRDPQTARIAIRALGRLERPAAIADLAPALRSPLPEVRAEAADAIAQAARGLKRASGNPPLTVSSVLSLLTMRLDIEAEPNVRTALCESIGRLPYTGAAEVVRAEDAILGLLHREAGVIDRLGAAKGFEALARTSRRLRPLGPAAVASLRSQLSLRGDPPRVRRLALRALMNNADGGVIADDLIALGAGDPDMQVRWLAVRAAATAKSAVGLAIVRQALQDPAPIVRSEALAASPAGTDDEKPPSATAVTTNRPVRSVDLSASAPPITVEELARLEAARARLIVRGAGTIELALFTAESPASVIRFARLVQAGFYNGLTFDAPAPEAFVQTQAVDAPTVGGLLPDEAGPWPHVRGSLGFAISHGTTDGRIVIQIADDPSLDHEHGVFGQVLAGIDIVDRLRDGDVIEKIDILPR